MNTLFVFGTLLALWASSFNTLQRRSCNKKRAALLTGAATVLPIPIASVLADRITSHSLDYGDLYLASEWAQIEVLSKNEILEPSPPQRYRIDGDSFQISSEGDSVYPPVPAYLPGNAGRLIEEMSQSHRYTDSFGPLGLVSLFLPHIGPTALRLPDPPGSPVHVGSIYRNFQAAKDTVGLISYAINPDGTVWFAAAVGRLGTAISPLHVQQDRLNRWFRNWALSWVGGYIGFTTLFIGMARLPAG